MKQGVRFAGKNTPAGEESWQFQRKVKMATAKAPKVYISKGAFIIIIWSAIEVAKRECMGFLLGKKSGKNLFITDAASFQSLRRRSKGGAETSKMTYRRFKAIFCETLENIFPKLLGDFHSHPEWGGVKPPGVLSETDIKDSVENGCDVNIVIVISPRRKGRAVWETLSDGTVKGSLGHWNLEICAFILIEGEDGKKEPQKIQIRANQAIESLNRV